MERFIPRVITEDMAAKGYNNAGRGQLIGYLAQPEKHEKECAYRKGNIKGVVGPSCTCRLGLWQETTATQVVVNEMRKAAKGKKKPSAKKIKSAKKQNIRSEV